MSDDRTPVIRTRHLVVGYDGVAAASVPDLDIGGGAVWHVTGPNGSGKTALLKTLAGLLPLVSGTVERACGRGANGVIFIHSTPYMFAGTVRRNLALARPREEDLAAVAEGFGLTTLLERDASQLSHGQQRRLALARAVLGRPLLLLVDEPEEGLDDQAIAAWRACAVRSFNEGAPVLVVAAHRPLALDTVTVKQVRLGPEA